MRKHPLPEQRVLTVSTFLMVILSIGLLAQFGRESLITLEGVILLTDVAGCWHQANSPLDYLPIQA